MPTEGEVQAFLEQLLDGLVAAGLGGEPHEDPDGEVGTYWDAYHRAADWATTPWSIAHRRGATGSK